MAHLKSALHDFLEDIAQSTHRSCAVSSYALVQSLLTGEKVRNSTPLYVRLLAEHRATISILGLTQAFCELQKVIDVKLELRRYTQELKLVCRRTNSLAARDMLNRTLKVLTKKLNAYTRRATTLMSHVPQMIVPFLTEPVLA